jgi:branched-chain amino acid transport system substrate-binding protein
MRRFSRLGAAALLGAGVAAAAALTAAAHPAKKVPASCNGLTYAHMGPLTGANAVLGQEQLTWDKFELSQFNRSHHTNFRLVEGDDQLSAAQGSTVAQQLVSDSKVLAVVGPAGTQVVIAAGAIFTPAHMAMVSESATDGTLSDGRFPTFFRVNANNNSQGPEIYLLIRNKLKPRKVLIVDDQSPDKAQLATDVGRMLQAKGISVDRQTVSRNATDFSSLIARIDSQTGVVFLSFQTASEGQLFGQQMKEQGKNATIVGANGVYSPSQFTIEGAYVASFAPDIHYVKAAKSFLKQYGKKLGTFGSYGPAAYVATEVVLNAMWNACKSGKKPTRASVLAQVKKTNIRKTIIGVPVKFAANGNNRYATFFLFHIVGGKYVPASVK